MNKTYTNSYKGKKLNISEEAYKAGDHAEKLVAQYFKNKGLKITDVSMDKEYQKQDVDFLASNSQGTIKVEVKYDSYTARTGAICVELRDLTWNRKSWFYTSTADLLVVVPKGKEYIGYAIRLADLRKIPESEMNLRKQKDPQSGHLFEVGVIDIAKIERLGVKVTALALPDKYEDEEGFSSSYIAEVQSLIGIYSLKEIEELGYTIPKSLLQ